MQSLSAVLSFISNFFSLIKSYFKHRDVQSENSVTQTDLAVAKEAEQMQSDIAQKQTSRPESQSDVLKRLKDHDA